MPRDDRRVTGPAARLLLEIDNSDDPVRGRIGASERELVPFQGWTELAAAIPRHRPSSDLHKESTP
jgi:hypothetical protein